jgi:hypothetical protein
MHTHGRQLEARVSAVFNSSAVICGALLLLFSAEALWCSRDHLGTLLWSSASVTSVMIMMIGLVTERHQPLHLWIGYGLFVCLATTAGLLVAWGLLGQGSVFIGILAIVSMSVAFAVLVLRGTRRAEAAAAVLGMFTVAAQAASMMLG